MWSDDTIADFGLRHGTHRSLTTHELRRGTMSSDSAIRNPQSALGPTRRQLLRDTTFGVGSVALGYLLNEQRLLANPAQAGAERQHFDRKPKAPHRAPKARAMISLFMQGG